MRTSARASWCAFWLLVGGLACTGCQPQAPVPSARASNEPLAWRVLGTWSGHGNSQTGSFTVETGALRLRWETHNERAPNAGRFRVALHSAISGRPLQTLIEHTGVGKDVAFAQDDPRVSYLVIESSDLDWRATLEEAVRR